ncbi:MAG: MCE family protein [Deltaproteobacteria bacterium]|nr:MCE family protein [Deltaproteobacteria bacterium]
MQSKIEFRVGVFIVVMTLLIASFIGYVAYKKGVFTKIHTFTLSSRSGEDLTEGMPVTFSGFTIGKVSSLELSDSGIVLIRIKVPDRHVKWLRADSRFIINKPLIGSSRIMVSTEKLDSPPLTEEIVPEVMTIADISEMVAKVTAILERVNQIAASLDAMAKRLSDPEGDLNRILRNAEVMTAKLSKKNSLIEMAVGDPQSVRSLHEAIRKIKDVVQQVQAILKNVEGLTVKTDEKVYGKDGVLPLVIDILQDVLAKMEKLNKSIDNINKISSDAAGATTDLGSLRAEIDATLDEIKTLVAELNAKISFKKAPEITLP